jgi:hypothetical protein
MLVQTLGNVGLRSWHLQLASLGSVGLCIGLWIRAKTVDQDERGNAERRALFVGLWPPMFWLIGNSLQQQEKTTGRYDLSGCEANAVNIRSRLRAPR